MVAKEVSKERGRAQGRNANHWWNSFSLWYGPVAMRVPAEAMAYRILNFEKPSGLVGYRGDVIYKKKEKFRIYLDFCAYGNLHDFNARYGFWDKGKTDEDKREAIRERVNCLPEPFLWYLMLRLTEACIELQYIPERCYDVPGRGGVHRDFKPDNIYLDAPDVEWRNYPVPKLGDLGLTIFTEDSNPSNPTGYTRSGTPGFMAPEQYDEAHNTNNVSVGEEKTPMLFGPRTNMWAVGMIVWALALGYCHPPEPSSRVLKTMARNPDSTAYQALYHFRNWSYSKELQEVVERCIRFDPDRRPWPTDLQEEIRDHMYRANLFPHQWPEHLRTRYGNIGILDESPWRIGQPLPARRNATATEQWLWENVGNPVAQDDIPQDRQSAPAVLQTGRKRTAERQPGRSSQKRQRSESSIAPSDAPRRLR